MKELDFVCFGADWHGHPTSTHHLMRQLAQHHRVLWVNSLGMRTPTLSSPHDLKRIAARAKRLVQHVAPTPTELERLWVIDPIYLPMQGSAAVQVANRLSMQWQLKWAMHRLGIKNPVVLTALPNSAALIPSLDPAAVIYYCLDDFTRMPGVDVETIAPQEQTLAAMADLILISAEHLRAHLEPAGTPIQLLSHGVDIERFSQANDDAPILLDIPSPRIGFFGAIDQWLDLDLIAATARARPDWHFPIIGPTRIPLDMFRGLANVHLLGAVPYTSIPSIAAGLDVGLLPFQVNDFTKAINPLKLREYFAAGLPAVSTSLPEVARYQPLVQIADTVDETIASIDAMLTNPPTPETLKAAVATEGWQARAADLSRWLAPLLHFDKKQRYATPHRTQAT